MISRLLSMIWRRLSLFQHPILWLLNSKFNIGVNLLILDGTGKIWLQQHRFWPRQAWGLPGGHMNYGETPEQAAAREMREETGLFIDNLELFHAELSWSRGMVLYYRAKMRTGEVVLDRHELLAADYFAVDALPSPLLPSHRKIIALAHKK